MVTGKTLMLAGMFLIIVARFCTNHLGSFLYISLVPVDEQPTISSRDW